jgi:sterol desaturase/sphingolipid hydroxylase (fatty acid hydroxylase superfamily)
VRRKIIRDLGMITSVLLRVAAAMGLSRFLAAIAVFVPLERVAPHRDRQPIFRAGWLTDLLSYLVNGTLFVVLLYLWRRAIPAAAFGWMKPLPFNLARQPVWVQAIATVALGCFLYYWGHRALHRFGLLWRFHSVHHSAEQLDWLATYRGHIFETCYFTCLTAVPMALLGLSTPGVIVFVIYRFFEGQIEHSNVRVPLGFMKWVVPSPWFHQWHHAVDVEAQNKNFSPYPVWDVLFGTAYMPAGRFPTAFGTDAPVPRGYLAQVAYPFGLSRYVERFQNWLFGIARPSAVRLRLDVK